MIPRAIGRAAPAAAPFVKSYLESRAPKIVGGAIGGAQADPEHPVIGGLLGAAGGSMLSRFANPSELERIASKPEARRAAMQAFGRDYYKNWVLRPFGPQGARYLPPEDMAMTQQYERLRTGIGNVFNVANNQSILRGSYSNQGFDRSLGQAILAAKNGLTTPEGRTMFDREISQIMSKTGWRRTIQTPRGPINFFNDMRGTKFSELVSRIRRRAEEIGAQATRRPPNADELKRLSSGMRNFARRLEQMSEGIQGNTTALHQSRDAANTAYERLMRYGEARDATTGLADPRKMAANMMRRRGPTNEPDPNSPAGRRLAYLRAHGEKVRDADIPLSEKGRRVRHELGRSALGMGGILAGGTAAHLMGVPFWEGALPVGAFMRSPRTGGYFAELARKAGEKIGAGPTIDVLRKGARRVPPAIAGAIGGEAARRAGDELAPEEQNDGSE